MEVRLEAAENQTAPSDTYISVRIGSHQKQAKFADKRTFLFQDPGEDGKRFARIEVFRRVGVATVDLRSSCDDQFECVDIPCKDLELPLMQLRLAIAGSGKTTGDAAVKHAKAPKARQRLDDAQKYMREHQLDDLLGSSLRQVLHDKPEDPHVYLSSEILKWGANRRAAEPLETTRHPRSNSERPPPPAPPGDKAAEEEEASTLKAVPRSNQATAEEAPTLKALPQTLPAAREREAEDVCPQAPTEAIPPTTETEAEDNCVRAPTEALPAPEESGAKDAFLQMPAEVLTAAAETSGAEENGMPVLAEAEAPTAATQSCAEGAHLQLPTEELPATTESGVEEVRLLLQQNIIEPVASGASDAQLVTLAAQSAAKSYVQELVAASLAKASSRGSESAPFSAGAARSMPTVQQPDLLRAITSEENAWCRGGRISPTRRTRPNASLEENVARAVEETPLPRDATNAPASALLVQAASPRPPPGESADETPPSQDATEAPASALLAPAASPRLSPFELVEEAPPSQDAREAPPSALLVEPLVSPPAPAAIEVEMPPVPGQAVITPPILPGGQGESAYPADVQAMREEVRKTLLDAIPSGRLANALAEICADVADQNYAPETTIVRKLEIAEGAPKQSDADARPDSASTAKETARDALLGAAADGSLRTALSETLADASAKEAIVDTEDKKDKKAKDGKKEKKNEEKDPNGVKEEKKDKKEKKEKDGKKDKKNEEKDQNKEKQEKEEKGPNNEKKEDNGANNEKKEDNGPNNEKKEKKDKEEKDPDKEKKEKKDKKDECKHLMTPAIRIPLEQPPEELRAAASGISEQRVSEMIDTQIDAKFEKLTKQLDLAWDQKADQLLQRLRPS